MRLAARRKGCAKTAPDLQQPVILPVPGPEATGRGERLRGAAPVSPARGLLGPLDPAPGPSQFLAFLPLALSLVPLEIALPRAF